MASKACPSSSTSCHIHPPCPPPAPLLQVNAYNIAMRRMCGEQGLPFFDTVPVTASARSFDGLHYGMDVTLLKAQLLLNYLEASRQGRAA